MTNSSNTTNSGVSHRSSRPGSADSRSSWLNMSRSTKTFKEHSIDKSVKRIDAIIEKDTSFIQSLEQKVSDREVARKQASELLNKRWNDNVYSPIMSSIHSAMDKTSDIYSDQVQEQYAHYLNHNNQSDGHVFLDVFNEEVRKNSHGDYQPLQLKNIQKDLIRPEKVDISQDPLKPQESELSKEVNSDKGSRRAFNKMAEDSNYNIESPERLRSRRRIKIDDRNRKSQISWSEWYKDSN